MAFRHIVAIGSVGLTVGVVVGSESRAGAFTRDCTWSQSTRTVSLQNSATNVQRARSALAGWEIAFEDDRLLEERTSGASDFEVAAYDFGNISLDGVTFAPGTALADPLCVDGRRQSGGQVSVFNTYYDTYYTEAEIRNVYSHEIGHSLGLGHEEGVNGCRPLAVMNSFSSVRLDPNCGVNGPQADDVAGIRQGLGK